MRGRKFLARVFGSSRCRQSRRFHHKWWSCGSTFLAFERRFLSFAAVFSEIRCLPCRKSVRAALYTIDTSRIASPSRSTVAIRRKPCSPTANWYPRHCTATRPPLRPWWRDERTARGVAFHDLGDHHAAEDAAQEAFVAAFRKLSSLGRFALRTLAADDRPPPVRADRAGAAARRAAGLCRRSGPTRKTQLDDDAEFLLAARWRACPSENNGC